MLSFVFRLLQTQLIALTHFVKYYDLGVSVNNQFQSKPRQLLESSLYKDHSFTNNMPFKCKPLFPSPGFYTEFSTGGVQQ